MISKSISAFVQIIDVSHEIIAWVKISKDLTGSGDGYIIVSVYIPPQCPSFYKIHNVKLFYVLETQIVQYSAVCHHIFVIGDLNSRTGCMYDFVKNYMLHNSIIDRFGELFTYVADETLLNRENPDIATNDYGIKLINLCKSSGLRVLNGRHSDGLSSDYSGPRSMSVIDYLFLK